METHEIATLENRIALAVKNNKLFKSKRPAEFIAAAAESNIAGKNVLGLAMKDIYELLRQKELAISRLEAEVEALRVVAPLLSEDHEAGDAIRPTATRSTTSLPRVQVSKAADSFP